MGLSSGTGRKDPWWVSAKGSGSRNKGAGSSSGGISSDGSGDSSVSDGTTDSTSSVGTDGTPLVTVFGMAVTTPAPFGRAATTTSPSASQVTMFGSSATTTTVSVAFGKAVPQFGQNAGKSMATTSSATATSLLGQGQIVRKTNEISKTTLLAKGGVKTGSKKSSTVTKTKSSSATLKVVLTTPKQISVAAKSTNTKKNRR
ncbi:hypothetical protein BC830DRAFT_1149729 [Chytriomyces sp. MP71]|nr:hypothetical protein BC830DRAFT_1149729 [Chytriomyces sp. MP71]